jgi:hypothetical protein
MSTLSPSTKFWSILLLACLGLLGVMLVHPTNATPTTLPGQAIPMKGVPTPHPTPIKMLHPFTVVQRLNQVDPAQYGLSQPYSTWWPSACSAAAMAEAMNAYGYAYRIADVLAVEASFRNPTVMTSDVGLWYPGGLDRTLHHFGFQAVPLQHPTLSQLGQFVSHEPVMVNFPPQTWQGGHFLIVTGADSSHVTLADSSRLNMQSMAVNTFLSYWRGLAFIVTPLGQGVQQ